MSIFSARDQNPRAAVRGQSGFGLLEAIVALTVLAGTGLALFAWINQSMQTAAQLQRYEREARLQLSAMALLETVNPSLRPEGELQQSGFLLSWRAELLEPERANASFSPPETGPWMVGLYRVQVQAKDGATGSEWRFSILKTGSRPANAGSPGQGPS